MLVINEREYKSLYDWCQLVSHHEMRSKEKRNVCYTYNLVEDDSCGDEGGRRRRKSRGEELMVKKELAENPLEFCLSLVPPP